MIAIRTGNPYAARVMIGHTNQQAPAWTITITPISMGLTPIIQSESQTRPLM